MTQRHKFKQTIDPHTGEKPWTSTFYRVPDAVIDRVSVTIEDETTQRTYGPSVLGLDPGNATVPPTPTPVPYRAAIVPGNATLQRLATLQLVPELREVSGAVIATFLLDWQWSMDSLFGTVSATGEVTIDAAAPEGQTVTVMAKHTPTGISDLCNVFVEPAPLPAPAGYVITVPAGLTANINTTFRFVVNVMTVAGAVPNPAVNVSVGVPTSGTTGGGGLHGDAGNRGIDWTLGAAPGQQYVDVTVGVDTVRMYVVAVDPGVIIAPPPAPPPAPSGNVLTPALLLPTCRRLLAKNPAYGPPYTTRDQRYTQSEASNYALFLSKENDPGGAYIDANHYSADARLYEAIRTGQPIGPAATDENTQVYARFRRIILRYLLYSKNANGGPGQGAHNIAPHLNTGMRSVYALAVLDGNTDARNHIHMNSHAATVDYWGYLRGEKPTAIGGGEHTGTDTRQLPIALQGARLNHLLGTPYSKMALNNSASFSSAFGSWKALGEELIGYCDGLKITGAHDVAPSRPGGVRLWVKPDGSMPSPAHGGAEAFLFNSLLVMELLAWNDDVAAHARGLELATLIMDHMIDFYNTACAPKGWNCLPYESTSAGPAIDLAGMFAHPALDLFERTALPKYKTFGVQHLLASTTGSYALTTLKQWNQILGVLEAAVDDFVF